MLSGSPAKSAYLFANEGHLDWVPLTVLSSIAVCSTANRPVMTTG